MMYFFGFICMLAIIALCWHFYSSCRAVLQFYGPCGSGDFKLGPGDFVYFRKIGSGEWDFMPWGSQRGPGFIRITRSAIPIMGMPVFSAEVMKEKEVTFCCIEWS